MPDSLDPFETVVAVAKDAKLYADPSETSKVVRDVTNAILRVSLDADPAPAGWMRADAVDTNGRIVASGFVREADVRSPIDYRAVFQKTQNRWWLGAFVAGD
jgi:hypothetical protein